MQKLELHPRLRLRRFSPMHLIAKFYQRRGLAVAIAVSLALLPAWLFLRCLPKMDTYPRVFLSNPLLHSHSRLLPFRYWNHRSAYPERYTDNSCMKLPEVHELQYAAYTWQLLQAENGSVYVYGAYYDNRFQEPLVRILIYTDMAPVPKLFCQLWFPDDNEPQTELADPLYGWNPKWGGPMNGVNEPYVLACRCRRHRPDRDIAPVAAAVVRAPCGVATNVLDVQNASFKDSLTSEDAVQPRRNSTNVAVCLKWLHYRSDVSVQLIEWLQLIKHFGAERVYIYIIRLHPNTRKVVKYYEDEGFVVATELSHPPQLSGRLQSRTARDFQDYRRELLPLNDCLYRSIGRHDWIASLDLDEIIVPPPGATWADVIDNQTAVVSSSKPRSDPIDAIIFPNYYVLDGAQKDHVAPAKTRILAHTWRSKSASEKGFFVKSFVNVSSVTTMHNHAPLTCRGKSCQMRFLTKGSGRMLHFRENCSSHHKYCNELHDVVREDILDGWRGPVLAEVRAVVEKLGVEGLD